MSSVEPSACPKCGERRVIGPDCPHCGVIYARAEQRLAQQPPPIVEAERAPEPFIPELERTTPVWDGELEQARLELRYRQVALPAALGAMALLMTSDGVRMLLRTFLSMWIHELGHAVAAWLSGFRAFPGPWFTPVSESRSLVVAVLLAALFVSLGVRMWRAGDRWGLGACAALLMIQLLCTLALSVPGARTFFTFAGDGGLFVLGTVLMATLYVRPGTTLHRGALRWGFLVIGAAAWMDGLVTWLKAWRDPGEIPFGMNEGSGLSDASKLVDVYGWTERALVGRYLMLAVLTGAVLVAIYVVGLRAAMRDATASNGSARA